MLKEICETGRAPEGRQKEPSGVSSGNPLIFPVKMLFSFYRNAVSEQLSADCAFDLSCSRFSAKALSEHGLLKGAILTVDRLTRCHPFVAHETLPVFFNNKTGKVIDEPSMY